MPSIATDTLLMSLDGSGITCHAGEEIPDVIPVTAVNNPLRKPGMEDLHLPGCDTDLHPRRRPVDPRGNGLSASTYQVNDLLQLALVPPVTGVLENSGEHCLGLRWARTVPSVRWSRVDTTCE